MSKELKKRGSSDSESNNSTTKIVVIQNVENIHGVIQETKKHQTY